VKRGSMKKKLAVKILAKSKKGKQDNEEGTLAVRKGGRVDKAGKLQVAQVNDPNERKVEGPDDRTASMAQRYVGLFFVAFVKV
jgi:hypothetical protein